MRAAFASTTVRVGECAMKRLRLAGLCLVALLLFLSAEACAAAPQPAKAKHTVAKRSTTVTQVAALRLTRGLHTAGLGAVLGYTNTDCGSGGSQIGGLVGGAFLAVSTWKFNSSGTAHSNERLSFVTPTKLRAIDVGPEAVVSASADGGHIAVVPLATASMGPDYCEVTPSTSVDIYSKHGAPPRQIATGPSGGVAISGKRLVVLTRPCFAGSPSCPANPPPPKLAVYDWPTGALVHTWPVVGAASVLGLHQEAHVQAYGHLVFYSVYRGSADGDELLHLLDLSTGKDVVVATVKGYGDNREWAIGPHGLVYVLNGGGGNPPKLVFVSMTKLLDLTR
jgi:hypothetical protein